MEKPFKVAYVVRTKHGVLYQAIKKRGWTVRQASEFLGIAYEYLSGILNLKRRPPQWRNGGKRGKRKFKFFCERLMRLTGKSFEDLFPEEVFNDEVMAKARAVDFFIERDLATLKIDAGAQTDLIALPEYANETLHYEDVVSIVRRILSPRQWEVIHCRYFQGLTLDGTAIHLSLGNKCIQRERVRQIEAEAFQKLRRHKHVLAALRGNEDIEFNQMLGLSTVNLLSQRVESASMVL